MLKLNEPTKSSFCSADKPQCAVATLVKSHRVGRSFERLVALTNSRTGTQIREMFSLGEWSQFLNDLGRYLPHPSTGEYHVGSLVFSEDEWIAFRRGVLFGDFDY